MTWTHDRDPGAHRRARLGVQHPQGFHGPFRGYGVAAFRAAGAASAAW
ncbi:hypothetical protein [Arthrobacter sp. Cr_A7]|nr:hypothetical protein [Arthrobacter sp. Cr_A7]MDF2049973.1 hypothetical protein [Arthrobacter sp. Cr_A7]